METSSTQEIQYTIEGIAQNLGASVKVIRRYVASGQLASRQIGTKYKVTESDYQAFCASFTEIDPTSGARQLRSIKAQFLPGFGVDPEARDMRKRGKVVGENVSSGRVEVADETRRRRKRLTSKFGDVSGDDVDWADIHAVWDAPGRSQRMTFVDLFCGAGGLSKGLEMSGMEGICGLDWFDERMYRSVG